MVKLRLEWITKSLALFYVCICELSPDLLVFLSFAVSCYFTRMLLQKCFCKDGFIFREIHGEVSDTLKYRVLISFQIIPLNWVKICRILKQKTGFVKLLTKRSRSIRINNMGLNEVVTMIII